MSGRRYVVRYGRAVHAVDPERPSARTLCGRDRLLWSPGAVRVARLDAPDSVTCRACERVAESRAARLLDVARELYAPVHARDASGAPIPCTTLALRDAERARELREVRS